MKFSHLHIVIQDVHNSFLYAFQLSGSWEITKWEIRVYQKDDY